jgi:hypothetical protein
LRSDRAPFPPHYRAKHPHPEPGESGVHLGIQPPRITDAQSRDRQWKTWSRGPEPVPPSKRKEMVPPLGIMNREMAGDMRHPSPLPGKSPAQ